MADETPPLDDTRLAEIRTLLAEIEHARERLHGLMGNPDRPRAPMVVATIDLLAEVERLRVEHNEARDLIDRLSEDLADHEPVAHPWFIDEANAWLAKHPKIKQP